MSCPLCLVTDKEKIWEEKGFFGLVCRKCKVPMIVLCAHRRDLTVTEQEIAGGLMEKHWPGLRARGIGLRSCPWHWHEHMVK